MSENKESQVILFPDYQALKQEVEKLRTEVSMLLQEKDELRYTICKNIEMEYMLKIGGLEYRAYQAQCEVKRLKRKMEMLQAAVNRQEKADLTKIEKQLDQEFAQYQRNLDEQMRKMNEALKRKDARMLSKEETKELKKLYHSIVKALHPDLNPDITDTQKQLFENAVNAYKSGDLEALRAIYLMVGEPVDTSAGEGAPKADAIKALTKEKDRLTKCLQSLQEDIAEIKSKYPYTMKEILEDEEKTEAKKEELNRILKKYEEMAENYRLRIDQLIRQI